MRRLVIKIGSNILTSGSKGLDMNRIQSLADDISAVQETGCDVIVVSSGAIASGMKKLGLKEKPGDIILKQAAAAAGQSSLMQAYEKCFSVHGKNVAQILLTREDLSDRKRYINSRNTINALLSFRLIPVINENDTVATDEIRFGDNDNLAALVSCLAGAERLLILSDVDGLFTGDPGKNPDAKLISHVEEITPDMEKMAGGAGSLVGTGGMYSKLLAAKIAVRHGIAVNIVNGKKPGVIKTLLLKDMHSGTEFKAALSRLSLRKGWIANGSRPKGSLYIDAGAVKALVSGGKSLLPSGILSVAGKFETGDSVYCVDESGRRIAKGITNYSSSETRKIQGKKTSEIEAVLGYKYSDEVINRDNLVLV